MDQALLAQPQAQRYQDEGCVACCILCVKIGALVVLTYGLMVLMFVIGLLIETVDGTIPASYETGGGILLAIFVANVIFWAALWCWGARQRDELRRQIVEKQLAIIRAEEQAEQAKDLEQERQMIEQRRRMKG